MTRSISENKATEGPHKPPVPGGVWSAAPTPLTDDMRVHVDDVRRMIDHHERLGVNGLFLAGTNGEGPWLPEREKRILVETVVRHVDGYIPVAVQVTDNSTDRILDNHPRGGGGRGRYRGHRAADVFL